MDVNLPGLDGIEATRRIRASDDSALARLPIIGISAHVQEDQIDAHLQAGMTGFVAKPVAPERLARALDGVRQGRSGEVFLSSRMPRSQARSRAAEIRAALQRDTEDFGAERSHEIARLFMERIQTEQSCLEQALDAADLDDLRATAHRMKSTLANYNQHEAVEIAAQIEALTGEGQDARARLLVGRMGALVPQLQTAMADALHDTGDAGALRSRAM